MNPETPARAMSPAPWMNDWLRLHLAARALLQIPFSDPAWSRVKQQVRRCAEVRRLLLVQATWN